MRENQKIKCVNCDKEFDVTLDTKPFCSKRCSYIDLNNWLGEKYSIHINEDDYEKDVYFFFLLARHNVMITL